MAQASRVVFVIAGLFWLLIGILTPIAVDRWKGPSGLFISHRTDQALFRAPPEEILESNFELATIRGIMIRALAGLLVAAGLLTAGLAWFGLREPRPWALAVLTAVGVAVLPYWWITLTPYRNAGIPLGLRDIPPFMWVPAIAMPAGSVLGWISHLRG